jgi:hypothetical protein
VQLVPFFVGVALMFSISLYLGMFFDNGPASLEPQLAVLYVTTSLAVIGIAPFLLNLFKIGARDVSVDQSECSCQMIQQVLLLIGYRIIEDTGIGIAFISCLHICIVALGYFFVKKDPPRTWLLLLNIGCCFIPALCYLIDSWEEERKKRKNE